VDTETVRKMLDPEEFIKTHVHPGGVAPQEVQRLLDARKQNLANAQSRQNDRKARIAESEALLKQEVNRICAKRGPQAST